MNSYLKMCQAVLSKSRQPLTAREILEAAYRLQLVPDHLFGKTQHKTLHARLCEDILQNRNTSHFVRTAPGRFSLASNTLPGDRKVNYVAPRRAYQLKQFDVLCADRSELDSSVLIDAAPVNFELVAHWFRRQVPLRVAEKDPSLVFLRLFIMIGSTNGLLTLTALKGSPYGRGRSIGILGLVKGSDADLFSEEPYGIDLAAMRTIAEQSSTSVSQIQKSTSRYGGATLRCVRMADVESRDNSVVLCVRYECDEPDDLIHVFPASRAPRWSRVPADINDNSTLDLLSSRLVELAAEGAMTIA